MRVAHAALWTSDLEGAATFLENILAPSWVVNITAHAAPASSRASCVCQMASAKIELMTAPWLSTRNSRDALGWDHIAIALGRNEAVDVLADRCGTAAFFQSTE
jgi:lactoylglutathione lyase